VNRLRVRFVFAAVLCLAYGAVAQSVPGRHRDSGQAFQNNLPAKAPVEPAPLLPEEASPSPAQVTYSKDTLTINANNATLGDILLAVHRQTGATIDISGNATDPVVGRFGPGPARDVLSVLLNGCQFNYVLLGSATNPSGLERVVLMSKAGGAEQVPSSSPVPQQKPSVVTPQAAALDDGAELPDPSETAEDQANQPQPPMEQQPPPTQNSVGQGGAGKTPEQLLQEMQQRQQQVQPPQSEPE